LKVYRAPENPIISPKDVKPSREDFEVLCAFNAAVTKVDDEVLLLLRVAEAPITGDPSIVRVPYFDHEMGELVFKDFEKDDPGIDFSDSRFVVTTDKKYLTSISHLRIARSGDGINFNIEESPAMEACNLYEMFGLEDPRITLIDDTYYINYSAISPIGGVSTCLASTKDWKTFVRHGVIFTPDNKDVAIFPQKINGKYYALNRPVSSAFNFMDIWISESGDLISWGNHKHLMSSRDGYWDNGRVGCSAVPFLIDQGWLEIYHASDKNGKYSLGAALLDKDEPSKVLARTDKPIMEPEKDYETHGFYGNVIFNCGVICEGGKVKIYYGAADTCMGYAHIELSDILGALS
jgi:predicted GH43/DUF377 family glycosyl hydrolase